MSESGFITTHTERLLESSVSGGERCGKCPPEVNHRSGGLNQGLWGPQCAGWGPHSSQTLPTQEAECRMHVLS